MRIRLIHTGGTIGMIQTDEGFASRAGVVETAVQDLIASGKIGAQVSVQTLAPLLDSAEATPQTWIRIAKCILEARDHDAFVLTHGTDTLAYTAGALCLALPGLQSPVIVTGAMRPLTVEGSDGRRNLGDALKAAQTGSPGVWVQFAGKRLHGARVNKAHSSAYDAFKAQDSQVAPLLPGACLRLNPLSQHKISVFSITPGFCVDILDYAVDRCDGLILRCYGSGTAPDTPEMRAALDKARMREIPIVAISQCSGGGMRLDTYAAGRVMRETGVIDGRDMTLEMAYVKMHFCLSHSDDYQTRCDFLAQSQCGELDG